MPNVALATPDAIETSRQRAAAARSNRRPGEGRRFWRWTVSLNMMGLILLALVLRCNDLANLPGINGDEAWYGVQAELCLHGEPIAWRTPSGNLLNPLFFVPQLPMHAVFGPSFVVLRATAVASGLLALFVNFWLCRRVFGRTTAIISTCVLAVLPIDIAYSRLAWDASQSLLATLPCIYLPLWAITDPRCRGRCTIAGLVALAVAIVVHPTNVFVAPVAVVCLGYAWREELLAISRWIPQRRIVMIAAASGAIAAGAFGVRELRPAWLGSAISRVANPAEYAAFAANLGRLFSGATVYEYVSGALSPPASIAGGGDFRWDCLPYDIAAWIVGGWLAWGLFFRARSASMGVEQNSLLALRARDGHRKRPELVCLIAGFGAGLVAFFLVAGPGGLAPNFERYAIWMVGPAAILASIAIESWQRQPNRTGRLSTILALAIGWALLLGFQTNCLGFMRQTGGRSHRTFRTAAVEPKQAALAYILAERKPRETVRIVTSEWWIYWPMRYLSMEQPTRLTVEMQSPADSSAWREAQGRPPTISPSGAPSTAFPGLGSGESWLVEFTDSAACKAIRQAAAGDRLPLPEMMLGDFSGQPLLSLFRVGAANVQNPEKN